MSFEHDVEFDHGRRVKCIESPVAYVSSATRREREYLIALVLVPSRGAVETQLANPSYLGSPGRCRHWDSLRREVEQAS